jgi:hypothetical protein
MLLHPFQHRIPSELDSRARLVPLTFRHSVSPGISHYGCRILCRADVKLPVVISRVKPSHLYIVKPDQTAIKPAVVVVRQNFCTLAHSIDRPRNEHRGCEAGLGVRICSGRVAFGRGVAAHRYWLQCPDIPTPPITVAYVSPQNFGTKVALSSRFASAVTEGTLP